MHLNGLHIRRLYDFIQYHSAESYLLLQTKKTISHHCVFWVCILRESQASTDSMLSNCISQHKSSCIILLFKQVYMLLQSVHVSCLANWCHVTISINAKVERGLNGWSCMPGGASQKSQGVDTVWQTKVHGWAITLLSNSNWCSCARTHASNCSSSLIRSRSSLYLVVSASLSCIKYCYCPCKSVLNPCLVHPMLSFYTFCALPCPWHLIAG